MGRPAIPVTVRAEQPPDQPGIWRVQENAFSRREEADLVDALRAGDYLAASSVAEHNGEIVGHAALSPATIAENHLLVLAPVAVDAEHQGLGVGTAVVEHVLRSSEGHAVSVLGEHGFYARFGFEDAGQHGIEAPFATAPGAFQILRGDLVSSGVITYAPPFTDI